MKHKTVIFVLIAILVIAAALILTRQHSAGAGEASDFDRQWRSAYADYRIALMQSNLKNRDATEKAMSGFEAKWTALVARFGNAAPPQFADDRGFEKSLAAVGAIFAKAKDELAKGDVTAAHQTLEAIREEIDNLEIRNGRSGFSQRVNAFHHAMEETLEKSYGGFAGPGLLEAAADAGMLTYLVRALGQLPPPEAASAPDFEPTLAALIESVGAYRAAILSGQPDAIKAARGKIKPAYARLFVTFG
jgi:hypothetical protein